MDKRDYVIQCRTVDVAGEAQFWSNSDGWVDLPSATVFTEQERQTVDLPMGALCWVALPT